MERLTYSDAEMEEFPGPECPVREEGDIVSRFCSIVCDEFQSDCPFEKMGKKLKVYEDAEEQGLLLRLPCKIGDDVYTIPSKVNYDLNVLSKHEENNRVYHQKAYSVTLEDGHWYIECDKDYEYGTGRILLDSFYKVTWFLSKEEAEKALEVLQSK